MVNNLKHNKSIKSLSMQNSENIHPSTFYSMSTKTLPCIRKKGSMTVEASFALPVFILCMALFLGLFRVLQAETQIEQALNYAAGRRAVYCQNEGSGALLTDAVSGKTLLNKSLKSQKCPPEYFKNGYNGILLFSESDENYVRYHVTYQVRLPIGLFGKEMISVSQSAVSRKWNGWKDSENKEETWVYITKTGKAYHKSTSCRYLDLSVRSVDRRQITGLRNKDGARYYACEKCGKLSKTGSVYITDYGTVYHSSLRCSGLKRTIYRVLETETDGRTPCKKCYGG